MAGSGGNARGASGASDACTGADRATGLPDIPAVPASGTAGAVTYLGSERGTRARIARLILENGPVTAAALSTRLGLTPAAVRRHLDNLLAGGLIEARTARRVASRGRGRPAKLFAITDAGRSAFEHAYDDLATSALRFLAEVAGPGAVAEFARRQVAELERRYQPVMESAGEDKVGALAEALSADGYAASATSVPALGAGGGEQLCQHHCPVALPGRACRGRVPAIVRGRDRSVRQAARHPGAAPGHDRARRRDLHHARDRARACPHPHDDHDNQ